MSQLVCEGDQGNPMSYEPGFDVIKRVHGLLCNLEDIDQDEINWDLILAGLPYFKVLPDLNFPPLYNIEEIENLTGFTSDVEEPEEESDPGMTFNVVHVYIDSAKKKAILEDFQKLEQRLKDFLKSAG